MVRGKKKREKEQYPIEIIDRSFMRNLRSLKVFVSNLTPIVKSQDEVLIRNTTEKIRTALKIIGVSKSKLKKEKSKQIGHKPTRKQLSKMISVLEGLPRLTPHNVELLYKSAFVILASYFDFLFSDLIHYFYQIHPESLSGKELSITLNELKLCNDISEAIGHIVNREVEKVSYKGLDEQIKYFENYLKIDCKKNIINWNIINEMIERRNIIVHNDSKINRRYLKNVDLPVIPEKTKDLKEGQKIIIKEDYFMAVLNEVVIAGTILIQCCWRGWEKDDISDADEELIRNIYDALCEEEWRIAEKLGLFSKECEVYNEQHRLYLDINYCQSLKWQNKKKELEKELEKFDESSLRPIYVLALSALKSDRDKFYKNIKKAITIDRLKKKDLMEWPLFRELRKDPNYEKKIRNILASIPKRVRDRL